MRDETEHTPTPPTSTTRSVTGTPERSEEGGVPPLPSSEREDAQRRWEEIEMRFVDDPAGATSAADELVGETMDRLTSRWHDHRSGLRERWDRDDASTEELRTTLKRYRATLEQLLSR